MKAKKNKITVKDIVEYLKDTKKSLMNDYYLAKENGEVDLCNSIYCSVQTLDSTLYHVLKNTKA
jgi:hypothetical protein